MVLFNQTFQMIFTNQEMYLTIAVFAIVMVVVNMICSQEFHYVYETAIVVGVIVNILLFLAVSFPFNIEVHVLPLMIETVICGVLAWIVQFFRLVLNYTAVEYLQFEDDEYYYYVKAVPKVVVATPEKTVKHITEHTQEKEDKDVGEQEEQETEWEEVKRRTDDLLLTQSLSRELGLDNDPNKRQP